VLKHRSLWGLRELGQCLGTLSPHGEEGVRLVLEMLRQVVELHPGLSTLHIGADEVNRGPPQEPHTVGALWGAGASLVNQTKI